MKALTVLRMVRQKEHDNDEVKFSDYDIQGALNEVLRYMSADLTNKDNEYLQKLADYDQDTMNAAIDAENIANASTEGYVAKPHIDFMITGIPFPDNYVTAISIQRMADGYKLHPVTSLYQLDERSYYVAGGLLYCKSTSIRLNYMGHITEVKNFDTGTIDLPDLFVDVIVKLVRVILNNGDSDTMTQAVSQAVDSVIPRRRYSNVRQKMPFYI